MMHSRSLVRASLLAVAGVALLLTGCADFETPAKETLAKVEASLKNVARDASKYAPEELKVLEDDLAAAKKNFDDGEYEQALLGARRLTTKIPELATTSGRKKNELFKQLAEDWQRLSVELPKTLDSIGARISKLGHLKTPPAGFDQAKTDFDSANLMLAEATASSAAGRIEEAVAKAKSVEEKAKSIKVALGMKAA